MSINEYKFEITEEKNNTRLDSALAVLIPTISRTRIKNIINEGFVKINKIQITQASIKIRSSDIVEVSIPEPKEVNISAKDIKLDIRYEDADLLIINKSPEMVVHPGAGNFDNTLVNALMFHCKNKLSTIGGELRPGIVHRIDKGTSGLLVVAKNDHAHIFLSKQFAEHTIKRVYEVLVYGRMKPSSGQISSTIGRSKFNRKKMSINTSRGKDAVTNYQTIKFFSGKKIIDMSFLECRLETGRTHQIRVHLSSHGNPIIGDQIYGKKNKFIRDIDPEFKELLEGFKRQALHAKSIGFIHPTTKKEIEFECEKPKDFENLLKTIKKLKF